MQRSKSIATGGLGVAVAAAVVLAISVFHGTSGGPALDGKDESALSAQRGSDAAVKAYFTRESYRPGAQATLVVSTRVPWFSIQIFRTGSLPIRALHRNELNGVAVSSPRRLAVRRSDAEERFLVPVGDWPSGVYYAELRAPSGDVGYAPLIVRPRRLGEHSVAVVLPTNTWQAYNRRDADGNGEGDTWYEDHAVQSVDMTRPFLDRGVPPHFGHYDRPFIRWLSMTGKEVDFLSDRDLMTVGSGRDLSAAYDLIVFPGHHEYVTTHEFDVIERYRDLGGNLMFLSANNFFWHVDRRGDLMTRTAQWRDLGRPESALIGVQYIGNDNGEHRGPYVVRSSDAGSWIFAGTGHDAGSSFGSFGIEIDARTPASPKGTQVLAEIPNLLGPGKTAQMSYYETRAGAKVFASGAFTLGGSALQADASRLLENLWARLAAAPTSSAPAGARLH